MANHANANAGEVDPLPHLESADPRTGSSQERGKPPDLERTRFESWFVEQFSTRPTQKSAGRLANDVSTARQELAKAIHLADRTTEWDTRYSAALKAWVAREAIREETGA